MTRKICAIFVFLLCALDLFLSILLGENGFLYKNQLQTQLKEATEVSKQLERIDENLQNQENQIYSEQYLKDKAIKQGYSFDQDQVFFFEKENLDLKSQNLYDLKQIQFTTQNITYLSRIQIFLIAFVLDLVIVFVVFLLLRSKGKKNNGS